MTTTTITPSEPTGTQRIKDRTMMDVERVKAYGRVIFKAVSSKAQRWFADNVLTEFEDEVHVNSEFADELEKEMRAAGLDVE